MKNKLPAKILFADDEADIRTIVQIALEDIGGFTVDFCASGAETLNKAKKFFPDLIILDMMMPDMDGITTLKALYADKQLAKIPVIFMTAKIQHHEIEQYRKLGAIGVIAKPFDPIKLAAEIRQIWNENHEPQKLKV